MSLEWKSCKIGDVVSVRRGASPRPIKDYVSETGVPWVKIADATSDQTRFLKSTKEFIKEEGVKSSVTVYPGDLIVSNSATPGLPKFMKIKACVHDGWLVFDDYDGILKEYLYYYFIVVRDRLVNKANGSVFKNLKTDIVRDFDIDLPPLETQAKIVKILSTIDEKIEKNIEINHNLINISKSIFRQKFLNYEGYEDFKDTDYGRIPSTFDVFTLNEISKEIVCGKTPSTKVEDNYGDKMPFITIPDMHNNVFIIETERKLSEKGIQSQKKKTLPKNSICVSCIATAGLVSLTYEESQTNQQINSIICKDNISPYFMYLYLNELSEYIKMLGSGGSTTLNLNKNEFSKIKVAIPNNGDMNKFNDLIEPIFNKIKFNQLEIIELTKLRDTLLPKLMNGEINVSKINCDLKLYFIKFILKSIIQIWRYFNMKTKLISKIQNQMKPFLNQGQYLKLTNSLLNSFKDVEILDNNNDSNETDNFKLLNSFLSAKQVEGRSEKTIVYYKSTLEKMLAKVNKQVYNITTDDIRKYLFEHKQEKDSSKITIDNMRRIFSSFFSWLEDEDYILKNPVRRIHRVKTGRVVKEVLTDENLEVLRDNCEEIRDLAIVEILISTGIRVGELVKLNIEDINFYERECVVFGKGESERVVYFDARTKIHLLEYLESRTDENPALFVSLNKPHERLGISGVETRLRELGNKCNIPKVHPHKFRRTLATNAIDKGMPIEQVQKLLGHVQIDTTMQYAMVNQSNVKIAHRKFIS